MLGTLRTLWLASALGFVACFAYLRSRAIDAPIVDRYAAELLRVPGIDAALNERVLEVRLGTLSQYDPLSALATALDGLHERLADVPACLGARGSDEVRARVAASAEALRRKEALIDRLKTENAVLRNSVRYFPILAREISGRTAGAAGEALGARLRDLLTEVLLFVVVRDADLSPRAREGLAALAVIAAAWPDARDRADLDLLADHARVILERRPRVDDLLDQILAVPTTLRVQEVGLTYARHLQAATEGAAARRTALFAWALSFVGLGAATIIARLKRSADALAEASARLREANEALRREQLREKELSLLKSRFVSMTSHEFRTPLSVILSSLELLEAYADRFRPEKKAEHFTRIKSAIGLMTRMLDDVLLLGRTEAGAIEPCPARLDLRRFCEDLVDELCFATRGTHTIALDLEGVPAEVRLDETLLRHVLTNLITNAVKYSPEGSVVRFAVRCEGDLGYFEVEDHGIGIPRADLPRLFESFHRASNAGNIKGTGLGLSVAKRVVDLQGGRIEVDSEVALGTTVRVVIPLGLTAERRTGGDVGAEGPCPGSS